MAGRGGLRELRVSEVEAVDVTLDSDIVFVLVRTGKGRIKSLSLEVLSVTHVVVGDGT